MMRGSPKTGYGTEVKAAYRHDVWQTFEEYAHNEIGTKLSDASILMLPGPNGREIPVALTWGAKSSNIVSVDKKPTIVAWHRRIYPDLAGTYGVMLSQAVPRMVRDDRKFNIINLDLCNAYGARVKHQVGEVSRITADRALVAITLTRGHDHFGDARAGNMHKGLGSQLRSAFRAIGAHRMEKTDLKRFKIFNHIYWSMSWKITPVAANAYNHMVWFLAAVERRYM